MFSHINPYGFHINSTQFFSIQITSLRLAFNSKLLISPRINAIPFDWFLIHFASLPHTSIQRKWLSYLLNTLCLYSFRVYSFGYQFVFRRIASHLIFSLPVESLGFQFLSRRLFSFHISSLLFFWISYHVDSFRLPSHRIIWLSIHFTSRYLASIRLAFSSSHI